ncbi:MAG: hypothetical protein EOO05_02355 [Chitinophagaceae bacterium]|nr:MAG: hypothetical protein EOO05_02355 [Chitinophagaceae bacterium]
MSELKMQRLLCILLVGITGCSTTRTTTSWLAEPLRNKSYSEILVAVVLPVQDSVARNEIEKSLQEQLLTMGYRSRGAGRAYGTDGLAGPGAQSKYITLCKDGFDAVLVVAPVSDKPSGEKIAEQSMYDSYYIDRASRFREAVNKSDFQNSGFHWEAVFIDLGFLRTIGVVRTATFPPTGDWEPATYQTGKLISRMKKEKIFSSQNQ